MTHSHCLHGSQTAAALDTFFETSSAFGIISRVVKGARGVVSLCPKLMFASLADRVPLLLLALCPEFMLAMLAERVPLLLLALWANFMFAVLAYRCPYRCWLSVRMPSFAIYLRSLCAVRTSTPKPSKIYNTKVA